MSAFEILVIVVLIAAAVVGFSKGFVKQIGSICAIVIAILCCRAFGSWAADVAVGAMCGPDDTSTMVASAQATGYIVLFLLVWLGVWSVARLLQSMLRAVHLGVLNSLGGSAFLILKWALVVSIVLNIWALISPGSGVFAHGATGIVGLVKSFAPSLLGVVTQSIS